MCMDHLGALHLDLFEFFPPGWVVKILVHLGEAVQALFSSSYISEYILSQGLSSFQHFNFLHNTKSSSVTRLLIDWVSKRRSLGFRNILGGPKWLNLQFECLELFGGVENLSNSLKLWTHSGKIRRFLMFQNGRLAPRDLSQKRILGWLILRNGGQPESLIPLSLSGVYLEQFSVALGPPRWGFIHYMVFEELSDLVGYLRWVGI